MVNIETRAIPDGVEVVLTGKIDERFDPAPIMTAVQAAHNVTVHLGGVRGVSSLGMRAFENMVGAMQSGGARKLVLTEVSPALATHFTLIPNLCAGAVVESARLPFTCATCGNETLAAVPWRAQAHVEAAPKCECGATMELDGIPEQYLPS